MFYFALVKLFLGLFSLRGLYSSDTDRSLTNNKTCQVSGQETLVGPNTEPDNLICSLSPVHPYSRPGK